MSAFHLKVEKSNDGVLLSLGVFETVFVLFFYVLAGPVLGWLFLTVFSPMEGDMPLFAKVIAVVLPVVFTGLLLRYFYTYLIKPVSIKIDFLKREIFLNNSTTSEYYDKKPWLKSIKIDDIKHFKVLENTDSDNVVFYEVSLCLSDIERLDLLILRSKKDLEYIREMFLKRLQVKEYKGEA